MRAIIPCGGAGTRMREIAGDMPKELLPLHGAPVLEHVARECAASGATEILVIGAPNKPQLAEWVEQHSERDGLPRLHHAIQPAPRGLADAIRFGRKFAGNEPVAVALPDNIFESPTPALAQVVAVHASHGRSAVAIVEIGQDEAHERGPTAVFEGRVEGNVFHLTRIPDKGDRRSTFNTYGAAHAYTGVGRYVFDPIVFDVIDEVEATLASDRELDDVPVMQTLLARGQLIGALIPGRFHDVGLPAGYLAASA